MNRKVLISLAVLLITISLACTLPPIIISQPDESDSEQITDAAVEPTTALPTQTPEVLACEEDLDCFLEAAADCRKADLSYLNTLEMMGMVITTRTDLSLLGEVDDLCEFEVKTADVEVEMSDQARDEMLESGQTEEQIETQLEAVRDQQLAAGFDEICRGDEGDLIAMLERWSQGSFSTEDWTLFNCQGNVFSFETAETPTAAVPVPEPTPTTAPYPTEVQEERRDNHLLNASFEQNPGVNEPIWIVEPRNTDVEAKWTDQASKIGQHSLMLSGTKHANQGHPGWFISEPIPINAGEWYLYYAWAMSPDGASAFVTAEFLDPEGNWISGQTSGCMELEPNIWKRVGFGINRTEGVAAFRVGMNQCLPETGDVKTHVYFDEVYLGQTGQ